MARTFNGTSDYIDIGTLGTFGSVDMTNAFTIAMYFKGTDTSAVRALCGFINTGSNAFIQIQYNANVAESLDAGKMRISMRGDGGTSAVVAGFASDEASINDGNWHSLVAVFDEPAATATVYLDGSAVTLTNSGSGSPSYSNLGFSMTIGARNVRGTIGQFFPGSIAEFAIWSRAVTAAEAAGIGKGFSPAFYRTGLRNYLPLIGRASPEPELRQGSNGTLTGTTNGDHPRIIYPSNYNIAPFAAAGGGTSVKDLIGGMGIIPFAR